MITAFRSLFLAVLWLGLLGIAMPAIDRLLYEVRLASMPAPAVLESPLRNVSRAALRDTWHASRAGGRRHEGIDIFSANGTPVHATTEGILIRRGQNKLGGNVVWVRGPAGQRHYYAHLSGFAHVVSGERIQPGRVIGYVGNTGNARNTPPHLHYGIYTRTGAINPFPLLSQALD